ncbi:hypothetical protein HNQ51_000246 [Inhella inkyongensis]|uniref:Uncharacterized protein n=1 Tax=Inhella inkyongensis TaxID=392593 RepID=A0A840RZH0_9BURK|nr:hypothetical protein [Inhella inkyongensis]MBB5202953.1 hypothetical protein [Inhella inkyongensis]
MSLGKQLDFWLIEVPAYALAAVAAFMIVSHWLSWPLGLVAAVAVILGLRALGPAVHRLLQGKDKQA